MGSMVRNGRYCIPGERKGSQVAVQTTAHKIDNSKGMTIQ